VQLELARFSLVSRVEPIYTCSVPSDQATFYLSMVTVAASARAVMPIPASPTVRRPGGSCQCHQIRSAEEADITRDRARRYGRIIQQIIVRRSVKSDEASIQEKKRAERENKQTDEAWEPRRGGYDKGKLPCAASAYVCAGTGQSMRSVACRSGAPRAGVLAQLLTAALAPSAPVLIRSVCVHRMGVACCRWRAVAARYGWDESLA
jgi:hypothetical protein